MMDSQPPRAPGHDGPPEAVSFLNEVIEQFDESDITGLDSSCPAAAFDELNVSSHSAGNNAPRHHRPSLDKSDRSSPSKSQRPSNKGRRNQELTRQKAQMARQQKELDALKSELSKYKVENEGLKAENRSLVDDLAQKTPSDSDDNPRHHGRPPLQRRASWFSNKASSSENGGSMQLLLDANSRLMTDNARLQVTVDALRKSFQVYIKESTEERDADREVIETLQNLVKEQKGERRRCSEASKAETYETSELTDSNHSLPKELGEEEDGFEKKTDDNASQDQEAAAAAVASQIKFSYAPARKDKSSSPNKGTSIIPDPTITSDTFVPTNNSQDLLVDFDASLQRRRRSSLSRGGGGRRWRSMTDGMRRECDEPPSSEEYPPSFANDSSCEDSNAGYEPQPRPRTAVRRWHSLRL